MYRKILVPLDGSHTSEMGLKEAIRLAKNQKATLRLIHVVDELVVMPSTEGAIYLGDMLEGLREAGKRILKQALAQVRRHGLRAQSVLLETVGARAADLVVRQAKKWGADIIVLGTHGRRGVRRLVMGSDAEQIVRTASVPVLLVRSRTKPGAPGRRRR